MENALLSELFGGRQRFALLRTLYLNPARVFPSHELAALAGVDSGNMTRWLKRWAEVGLVIRKQEGRNVTYQASNDPRLQGLCDIARRSDTILDDVLAALPPEAEAVVVVGSVARGEERAESDLDVLVLGNDLSEIRVNARLLPVGRKHHREVHASVFSRAEFEQMLKDQNGFALGVISDRHVLLKGEFGYGRSTHTAATVERGPRLCSTRTSP